MNCRTFMRKASSLMDKQMEESDVRLLGEHLDRCSSCRTIFEKDVAINERMRLRSEIVPHPELAVRVEQAVLGHEPRTLPLRIPLWAQACVAVLAVLVSIAAGALTGTGVIDVWDSQMGDEAEFLDLAHDTLSLEDMVIQLSQRENI